MKIYTQAEIDELIGCPKRISEPPKRGMRTENGQKRNDMRLQSQSGDRDYRVFMRVHDEFTENFSIGLVYLAKDGSGEITLLRCNGPHGEYNDRFDPAHPHSEFHIHRATEAAIRAGLKPEKRAERTQDFASWQEALGYFLHAANIDPADAAAHFPDHRQERFPFVSDLADSGESSPETEALS